MDYSKQTVQLPDKIYEVNQEDLTQEDLFITVRQKLIKSFQTGYSPGKLNVVPLSGGLDSRAVLGGLLQFTEAVNLVTYTFGVPGSWDFEIASKVARSVGVNNIRIPLENYDYSLDELIEVSRCMDHQTLLFFHAPYRIIKREFSDHLHWSGFLGEAITGDHIRGTLANSMEEAKQKFLGSNRFIKGAESEILSGGMDYAKEQLHVPSADQGFLTYEEGLDLLNRQNKYIAPHVMLQGFEHRAPFNDPQVIAFFLGLTEAQKRDQVFFKEFLQWWKPSLFELPVKNNMGLPLGVRPWRPKLRKLMLKVKKKVGKWNNPNINYFNFSNRILYDDKFRALAWAQINDLKNRKVLPDSINPESLWSTHQKKIRDHGPIIQGLVSLEIHLKAGKKL